MSLFAEPTRDGCAINEAARQNPLVRHMDFEGEDWLYFPALRPGVAIIRASTVDENGRLVFE
ncbi:hypothetical protein GKA01_20720 [Gluconobacter kanchanaburiensis NBRC 103587]|uniref:Uncharacterized protein n=1 Tax=Gluconobacter kanchanaburiensis NBRC 103587 TaxID=1307948 RepID=A0A511B8U6_9PROT|nr:hypothetical protein AA103587_2587 [Gluconobacter kanchanaburiensis NBRC 103587]GEK96875.1 hypothetical protein GKA01_20720 [Gluconobacter kanchanaburiensis NBRC 103587]